jgi:hypothetical protein
MAYLVDRVSGCSVTYIRTDRPPKRVATFIGNPDLTLVVVFWQ